MDKSNVTNGTKASPNKNGKNGESGKNLFQNLHGFLQMMVKQCCQLMLPDDPAESLFDL